MNVLILAAGTRNKIVQYFRKTLEGRGKVIATDSSNLGPALYDADKYYIVPPITEPGYIDGIIDICRKEEINGVLSLIDPELSLLAKNEEKFREAGAKIVGSSYELCELALDKYEMFKWLSEHGYRCARSWMDKDEFYKEVEEGKAGFPVFIKPARGSASISISKVYDRETADLLFDHEDGLMIQEFLDGTEIGADVYIDMISGEVVSIFTKEKIKMRAGETDKAVSINESKKVVEALQQTHHDERLRFDWLPGASHGALARIFYLDKTYIWLFSHSLDEEGRPVNREITIDKSDLPDAYDDIQRREDKLYIEQK